MAKLEVEESDIKQLLADNRAQAEAIKTLTSTVEEMKNAPAGPLPMTATRILNRTVRVLFIDGHAIVGYKNQIDDEDHPVYIYTKPNPDPRGEPIEFVDILLDGVKEPQSVNFKELKENATEKPCKVIKREEEEIIDEGEEVEMKEVKGYNMIETGVRVPLTITSKKYQYIVDVGGGKLVTFPENAVNIR